MKGAKCRSTMPIQPMRVERLSADADLAHNLRVNEVRCGVSHHAEPLDHGDRARVRGQHHRDDLVEVDRVEPTAEPRVCRFGRKSVTPEWTREPPADLD